MKNLHLLRQTEKPAFSHHGKTLNTFVSLVIRITKILKKAGFSLMKNLQLLRKTENPLSPTTGKLQIPLFLELFAKGRNPVSIGDVS
ncbi:hypothetical protein [Brunnivagina elsteri]|uniref:Uncharacterized protein n=1 Tax=Brunnivagina elsteri CCALA 953 TaxID=987040 RepID=A0A2A2TBH4_9CYAN|nr:hypothetical protein [Calothrix elsteri]PAX51051.1 hypothetical protein CK510_26925 [Calothrix elsteri CCALA 953]